MFEQPSKAWSKGQTDLPSVSSRTLKCRLAEAITWCNSLAWPADFRSPNLRPTQFHETADDLVCELGLSRQRRLSRKSLRFTEDASEILQGRLLLYFPDATLSDGAAEVKSGGFFDVYNMPPCDTWVTAFEDPSCDLSYRQQLLCYVPTSLVALADAGIEVNPEDCICWLDRAGHGNTKSLLDKLQRKR